VTAAAEATDAADSLSDTHSVFRSATNLQHGRSRDPQEDLS
jgi:hypothetical protein